MNEVPEPSQGFMPRKATNLQAESTSRGYRRREATRRRIIETAARAFAEHGVDGIRLDELSELADVARGTLYNYFRTKDDLIEAIVEPVLQRAAAWGKSLEESDDAREDVEAIIALQWELWSTHRDALLVAAELRTNVLERLALLHRRYVQRVMTVLERADCDGHLVTGPERSAMVLHRVTVPLLQTYADEPDAEQLFSRGLSALLLRGPDEH